MSEGLFLRLLSFPEKSSAMADAICAIHDEQNQNSIIYIVDPSSFSYIPGSTFAYWINENIRRLFNDLPSFGEKGYIVKQGIATADDFQFVRAWWEVAYQKIVTGTSKTSVEEFHKQTYNGKCWIPFSKGGAYSPYYSDLHLVINWERDGAEIKQRISPETGRPYSNVWQLKGTEDNYFFRPGLTWPRRTDGLSFRALPLGCIFGDKGPTAFANGDNPSHLLALSAIMNSSPFYLFVQALVARVSLAQSFEVGLIQSIPIPDISSVNLLHLHKLAFRSLELKRIVNSSVENSHVFTLPAMIQIPSKSLSDGISNWQANLNVLNQQLTELQNEIDNFVFYLYGIKETISSTLEELLKTKKQILLAPESDDDDILLDNTSPTNNKGVGRATSSLLSYILGCSYGCWDIRFATGERSLPEFPNPFAPLPVCSPGMLTSEDGLPLHETPLGYPIAINWNGILVDDPEHPEDIIRRVRDVLRVIWQDRADAIEQEACQILGVKELRDYFRRSGNGGFWTDHVQRYSKSRRKAPIYWLLQSSRRNYAVWLYYHRLNKDTLFRVLNTVVEPKVRLEETQLEQLRTQLTHVGTAGREAKQLERQLERQENFISELEDFRDKLRRAADLNLEPDLNDGVVLNIAPLWELVPWNEAKRYWQELQAGKYEWSTIGKQLRERGLV